MNQKLTSKTLKSIIFEAFKDVRKGEGIGVRECAAADRYASESELEVARGSDIEKHWWEYPEECKKGYFEFALNYNNRDGVIFHLPALMTSVVEGHEDISDITVYMQLCEYVPSGIRPHHGNREYLDYLRSINIKSVISYCKFTPEQVNATSLYLLWQMHADDSNFFQKRESWIASEKKMHTEFSKYAAPGDYTLTVDDAIAIVDEEHRVIRDWFTAGGVKFESWEVCRA